MSRNDMVNFFGEPLTERDSDGINVALFCDLDTKTVYVYCHDIRTGTEFTFDPPNHLAMDAYRHPFAYANAALNGKTTVSV